MHIACDATSSNCGSYSTKILVCSLPPLPYGLNELPDIRFKFPFNLITWPLRGFSKLANHGAYSTGDPEQGFSLWLAEGLNHSLACEQTLRGALAARREMEGELATTFVEIEFHLRFPCVSPSTELLHFCQSSGSGNGCECKQNIEKHVLRVMTSLLSSPLISISHRHFPFRNSNFRDVVASSPSFSRPAARACSQANLSLVSSTAQARLHMT